MIVRVVDSDANTNSAEQWGDTSSITWKVDNIGRLRFWRVNQFTEVTANTGDTLEVGQFSKDGNFSVFRRFRR